MPLSVHEYTTTGGVTLRLANDIYINAPFDNPYVENPEAVLDYDSREHVFRIAFRGHELTGQALPLPGYLSSRDSAGRPVTDVVFSHVDRVRISPVGGCTMTCQFCDIPGRKYTPRPADQLLEALDVAMRDTALPAKHVLISGGTPGLRDFEYFDDVCRATVEAVDVPVDVMMPPRQQDPGFIDRLSDMGVNGYAINLEVYDEEVSRRVTPQKYRLGPKHYAHAIERAVARTGGNGRVRSLILVGLEPEDRTLAGVEFLARLGCDPVLSPFRPSPGTVLVNAPAPTMDLLERVYQESLNIVEKHGVKLGPRCIPCQHNTLTFPDSSGAYHYH